MNYRSVIRSAVARALNVDENEVALERTRVSGVGDLTTNHVIRASRGDRPAERAFAIAQTLSSDPSFGAVTASGPGFLNFSASEGLMRDCLVALSGSPFPAADARQSVCVEFVSANPTGPLHVGHANGAFVGSAIAAMLSAAGHDVTSEYYVNDRGAQIGVLGASVRQRMRQLSGLEWAVPANGYPGEYVVDVARRMLEVRDGGRWAGESDEALGRAAASVIISEILDQLGESGIEFDQVVSETDVISGGAYRGAVSFLLASGLAYRGTLPPPLGEADPDWHPQETLLFASSKFGDDSDRALERHDGTITYFGADCAYHWHKSRRGFDRLINVLGADHAGYTSRIGSFVRSLEGPDIGFKMTALVKLVRDGSSVKMSKRAGAYVTVADAAARYGSESLRYFLLSRAQDDVITIDEDKGIGNDRFADLVGGINAAAGFVDRVVDDMGAHDFYGAGLSALLSEIFEMPDHGPARDLAIAVMEFPEVAGRAVRDLTPNVIADYAHGLSQLIVPAIAVSDRSTALTFHAAGSVLRSCAFACGTPEEALSADLAVTAEPGRDGSPGPLSA